MKFAAVRKWLILCNYSFGLALCHFDRREKSHVLDARRFLTPVRNDAVAWDLLSFRPQGEISSR